MTREALFTELGELTGLDPTSDDAKQVSWFALRSQPASAPTTNRPPARFLLALQAAKGTPIGMRARLLATSFVDHTRLFTEPMGQPIQLSYRLHWDACTEPMLAVLGEVSFLDTTFAGQSDQRWAMSYNSLRPPAANLLVPEEAVNFTLHDFGGNLLE